jgi:proteic killer suppression protein
MDILFKSKKDRELCNKDALLRKKYRGNPRRYKLIRTRLDELADAENLEVMRSIPQSHCHELKGSRKGQLAVNLDQGHRMTFEPANEPVPRKADGGLDWSRITAIRILQLAEDYHD